MNHGRATHHCSFILSFLKEKGLERVNYSELSLKYGTVSIVLTPFSSNLFVDNGQSIGFLSRFERIEGTLHPPLCYEAILPYIEKDNDHT